MSSQNFLLILALFFSIIQTDSLIDEIKIVNLHKDVYAEQLVNRQLYLIAYCDKSGKCNEKELPTGYIAEDFFLPFIFNNNRTSDENFITSCYNNGYIFTFFSDDKSLSLKKGNAKAMQVSALLDKKGQGKTFYVNKDSPFYSKIPSVLCSYDGKEFEKEKIAFFLVNYNG